VHGATYEDHPVAAAAALEVQQIIESEGLVENSRKQGMNLLAQLEKRLGSHPCVCHIRGRGLFCGVSIGFP
jgi:adenosylmethionine-8-amino-7-oxononanoate aminotransferase